jgi:hypothetical protein
MITEKQIEKHKFFTTNGTDIWRVKSVSTFTLVQLINCETGGAASARVGEKSEGGFVPVRMPKVKNERDAGRVTKTKKKTGKKKKTKAGKTAKSASKSGRGVRPGGKASSQYLGVTVKKNKAGKKRFYAQSNRGGKYARLGAHDVEELAAAAVQEHLGNAEEATRLRMLAKKKQGTGQTKAPASKKKDGVEHRRMFPEDEPISGPMPNPDE